MDKMPRNPRLPVPFLHVAAKLFGIAAFFMAIIVLVELANLAMGG